MTGPVTAAQALRGLAADHPPGRLATPLPTAPAAATEHLRHALAQHAGHQQTAAPLHLLTARPAATVAALDTPVHSVIKLHADPRAYDAELLAYTLVGNTPYVPRLLSTCDSSCSLLLEYLPGRVDWRSPRAPAGLIDAVAALHSAPDHLDPQLASALSAFRLGHLAQNPAPAWARDVGAWAGVMSLCRGAYGPDRIPVGHLDLKPEHLRIRASGQLALVDIETLRPDITGLIDLVTLPAVLRQAGQPLPGPHIRTLYLHAARHRGLHWNSDTLKAALTAFQRATGLETLDHLAD